VVYSRQEWWIISDTFSRLEPEKQQRILRAAYREFASRGFEKASTNSIVEEAGIGKGMLFYYFNSKTELFFYLIEQGINFVIDEYLSFLDDSETDFIEKYKQAARAKLEAYQKNPHVFNFLGTLYISQEIELPEEVKSRLENLRNNSYQKLFQNIDTSRFRKDIAPDKIIKLIKWTLDGYEQELINRLQGRDLSAIDFAPYWEEFFAYADILKIVYYRKGED